MQQSWIAANSEVARFITHVQTCYQPHLLQDRFDVSGKTRNIAIRLVLQQCSKASSTLLLFVFPYLNMLISPPISSNSLIFGKVLLSLLSQPLPHLPFFLGKSPEDEVAQSLSSLRASSPQGQFTLVWTPFWESELRFNRSTHLRYLHVQISWGKLGVICVIKNIYNLQEFVFYKRHIFLLFSFFSVHNVSLNGAWRGFVPEGGRGGGTWGILGWGCTTGTLSLYQTRSRSDQFSIFFYLPFIFLLLIYLAFCKLQCLVSIKLFFC